MRTLLLVAFLAAAVLCGIVFLAGGDREPGTRPAPDGSPPAAGARDEGELAAGREPERRPADAPSDPEPAERPPAVSDDAPRALSSRSRELQALWDACADETEPELLRLCLAEKLQLVSPHPEDLAALVCGEVPPDGIDRIVVEEVAASWPPDDAPRRIRQFQRSCNDPGNFWAGFVELQAERDPAWLEAFSRALLEDALADDDLVLLFCVDALATEGDEAMAAFLQQCARGALGASDAQVAYALANAYANQPDAASGLEFLRSVASSPTFEGRTAEVRAFARCLLEGAPKAFDAERTLGLIHEVLDDPVLGPGFAAHVRDLASWNRLPLWLTEEQREALVARAR